MGGYPLGQDHVLGGEAADLVHGLHPVLGPDGELRVPDLAVEGIPEVGGRLLDRGRFRSHRGCHGGGALLSGNGLGPRRGRHRRGRPGGGGPCGGLGSGRFCRRRFRHRFFSALLPRLQVSQDVLLGHTPGVPRSLDRSQVDAALLGDPPNHRSRPGPQAVLLGELVPSLPSGSIPPPWLSGPDGSGGVHGRLLRNRSHRSCLLRHGGRSHRRLGGRGELPRLNRGGGRPLLLFGRGRCGCRLRRGRCVRGDLRIEVGHHGADFHGLALLHQDLHERPLGRGWDLGIHLVRGDLENRFVPLHGLPDPLQPLRNRTLRDGFAHLGHRHFDPRHARLPGLGLTDGQIFIGP